MWSIKNRTPYAAERTWLRDGSGAHRWVVAVKGTFEIAPRGTVTLADAQPPPSLLPQYTGDPGASSLSRDVELGADKPTTDLILNGSAHAPNGQATSKVAVAMRVGPIEKVLVVFGTRVYYRRVGGVALSAPAGFVERPLVYELAYGGTDRSEPDPRRPSSDPRNPIGRGFAVDQRNLIDQPAHCIEHAAGDPARVGPAGFGAIAPHWSPRAEHAGTYDDAWRRERSPLLPADWDPRFTLAAPADQRPPRHLRGGEAAELVNLTPNGLLRFTLPKVWLTFTTWVRRRQEEHRAKLATVLLEPEAMRLTMVWQTSLVVGPRDVDHLDSTLIGEKSYIH
jgi:hypothetical protein